MAVPVSLSVSTRIQYFPAQPPAPNIGGPIAVPYAQAPGVAPIPSALQFQASNPALFAPETVGSGPLPGMCVQLSGQSPDYLGSVFAIFEVDGTIKIRRNIISTTTWSGQGSNPAVAHWNMADTTT